MIEDVTESGTTLVIESDNCSSQYKSVENFHNLQELSNKFNVTIIYLYGIAGHGKGEVDHVGGIAKISIRREIAAEGFMSDAGEMVDFLKEKFGQKTNPKYVIKEIDENILEMARAENKFKKFKTIDGSTKFQALRCKPGCVSFKAAPYICSCELCIKDYGSCDVFKSYDLDVQILNETFLRSHDLQNVDTTNVDDADDQFFAVGSIGAVAAAENSPDTVWFIKVTKEVEESDQNLEDSWGNVVLVEQMHLRGYFLERIFYSQGTFVQVEYKKRDISVQRKYCILVCECGRAKERFIFVKCWLCWHFELYPEQRWSWSYRWCPPGSETPLKI